MIPSLHLHQFQTAHAHNGTELLVGGMPVSRLADCVGREAFYAYDRDLIAARIASLRAVMPGSLGIRYALKANPFAPVACLMAGLVDGMDVASGNELLQALSAGVAANDISFAGPGKGEEALAQAIAAGCLINVESAHEVEQIAMLSKQLGHAPRIALRLNPNFELRSAGMRMGGGARPFGVDSEAAPALLEAITGAGLVCEGLHIFGGSQSLKADAIASCLEQSYALAESLLPHFRQSISSLSLGGGFGIPYFPGEEPLDIAPIAAALNGIAIRAAQAMPSAKLHIELGRYLVGEAGFYVSRIVDRKVSRGRTFLITAGGMNHHLAASGNLGQVIRKNYPVALGNRFLLPTKESVTVCGPLCSPLDILAEGYDLPHAQIGDLIVVFQSGAYGASASPQGFLSHEPLTEVLV